MADGEVVDPYWGVITPALAVVMNDFDRTNYCPVCAKHLVKITKDTKVCDPHVNVYVNWDEHGPFLDYGYGQV